MSVTANDSTQQGSPVTCYECERGDKRWHSSRREASRVLATPHCRTCHQNDHYACRTCGSCLPRASRWDRLYCSSSCRVKAHHAREGAKLERAVWEAEHPEETAKERAEFKEYEATLKSFGDALGIPKRDREQEERKHTADRCAHETCDKPFGPGDVIYRRSEFSSFGPVLPYCSEHCCRQSDGRHNKDAPEGSYYPGCSCEGRYGDPKWTKPEPCTFCGRPVRYDRKTADPHRFTRDWVYSGENDLVVRTFCSDRCKRADSNARRLASRPDLRKLCGVCSREFTPTRTDARYCSNACRQRAYRQRTEPVQASSHAAPT